MSSRLCWFPIASWVKVDVGAELVAHVTGIGRCGSPWACPMCAPVIRERRAGEIDQGLSGWLADGHGAEFVTLTVRHQRGDDLAGRLAAIAGALHDVLAGAPWKRRRVALGYVGAIRCVDITWSNRNGWHPHLHAVLAFERPLTESERADLREWLHGRWDGLCARRGFGTVHPVHGVGLQAVRSAEDLAGYLTKVDGGWSAGLELARADLKHGRVDGLTPMELLRELAETGETRLIKLWQEYEAATRGKRAIVWSPGLRQRMLGVETELTDEELAASEGADLALLRAWIRAARWSQHATAATAPELLDGLEDAAAILLTLTALCGHIPRPIDKDEGPPDSG